MLNLDIRPRGPMILLYMDNNNQSACLFILFVRYDIHLHGQLHILDLCKINNNNNNNNNNMEAYTVLQQMAAQSTLHKTYS